jgi:hypothetical protein
MPVIAGEIISPQSHSNAGAPPQSW